MPGASRRAATPGLIALSCVGFIASAAPAMAQTAPASPVLGGMTVTDTAIDEEIKVEHGREPEGDARR